jgi:hypothetical protein
MNFTLPREMNASAIRFILLARRCKCHNFVTDAHKAIQKRYHYLAPLLVLQGGSSLSAFTPQQLQALALVFLKLNTQAFDIYLVFFGFWCVLIGYLIFRSTFLPRILGVLLVIDGLGWMLYLSPPLATYLFPVIAVASGLAELPLVLWLLVVGVNVQRWKEQAGVAGASLPT